MYYIIGCKYVFYIPRVREFFGLLRTFKQHAAKKREESRRYDRLIKHVAYKGL